MKYGQDNLNTWTDFQGEYKRGQRWLLRGDKPVGRPDFIRDLRAGENQLGKVLSPDYGFMRLSVALAEQGPEGRALALMLAVAIVTAAGAAALTSHPVFGHSYIGPDSAGSHPTILSADCDVPVKRADILAVTSGGAAAEVSFNDGLKAMPPDPSADNLACRFRQIAASLKSGELRPHDIETKRHLGIFFGEDSDFQLLADIKDWGGLAIDPAEAAAGGEMGLILVDRSKNMAEPLLEQVSFFYARANGYEARPGAPSYGAKHAYFILNDIFGFAGEFDSTTRSTCVTHQGRAASRFSQPTVIIDRAVWTPRIAVGGERSIFKGNPELRSSDARIGMLFREIEGRANVDVLIRNLRAEKLDAIAVEIAKGKFLVVAGFDPESENVDFPGLKNVAAGDRDSADGVGDGAWMVRCGPAVPLKPRTPTSLTPLGGPALTETAKSPSTPSTPRTPVPTGTPHFGDTPTPPVAPTETPRPTDAPTQPPQDTATPGNPEKTPNPPTPADTPIPQETPIGDTPVPPTPDVHETPIAP